MKYSLTFVALVSGYIVACVYLSFFATFGGHKVSEFWISIFWAGLYGFPLGFFAFVFFFRCISSSSTFWRFYIAPFVGGAVGWTILMVWLSELALTIQFGGFAFMMGFTTFFFGAVFHNKHRRMLQTEQRGHNKPAHSTQIPP